MSERHIYDQIIIGAGFAGICMAIKLKQAGMDNFAILERNSHLGGTWWDNAYPGAACDVESHLYSYSFEPNPNWSRNFSPQEEILKYLEHCVEKYDIKKHIWFNHQITSATYIESASMWNVVVDSIKDFLGRSLISCSGGLSQPSFPDIKGIDSFKGEKFHSAKWDKNYDLSGKTVAVIGTGASAIQIIPAIAPAVKELYVFQRTAPWIIPKPDKEISPLRKWLYNKLPFTRWLYRFRLYWTHELMAIGFTKNVALMKLFGKLALRNIENSVSDETLRKKVTPNYIIGCKRVLLSNDYYPALQRKNVWVITEGIRQITGTGILTVNDNEHKVDAIIFATGFKAADGVVVFDITGKKGLKLNTAWANGAEAYLGTSVSGFPNLFLVVGPNTGLGHSSMILMIEAQVNYILQAQQKMIDDNLRTIDVKPEVQKAFNTDLQNRLAKTVWQTGGCHSWYQDKNGKNVTLWPGFTFTFISRTKNFDPVKYKLTK